MKYYIRLGGILFLIASIATGLLSFVNSFTAPVVSKNQKNEENAARISVLPIAEDFEEKVIKGFKFNIGKKDNQIVGYTFISSGVGYSSTIKTMVGVDTEFVIKNIEIIFQAETPGLGANAVNNDFKSQFIGKDQNSVLLTKDGGDVQAITGATITSAAIVNSINQDIEKLKQVYYEVGE